jgi:hypothetical protein
MIRNFEKERKGLLAERLTLIYTVSNLYQSLPELYTNMLPKNFTAQL